MAKIVSKSYLGIMPVYNMEVYKHHNYVTPMGTVLHNCRYYCISRTLAAEKQKKEIDDFSDYLEDAEMSYQDYMCGGTPTSSYLGA